MTKTVLNALWQKICGVFVSNNQLIAQLSRKQDKLTAGIGIRITENNVINNTSTEETVRIAVTTDVDGVSVSGLMIDVFYNNSDTPSETITTNAHGMAEILVPHDYKYRLRFPDISGCDRIPDVVHYSTLVERSIEVSYVAESVPVERVRVAVKHRSAAQDTVYAAATVNVSVNGETVSYTADSDGIAEFYVPYGEQYTVSCPAEDGWRTPTSQTYMAGRRVRGVVMKYLYVTSALLIVDADGTEWIPDDFYAAVNAGTKQNSDAKMVEFVTDDLVDANGVFGLDIDMFADDSLPANAAWASSNVQFNSIPLNGNSANQLYYLDGLNASKLIQAEGDERGINTPFVDACLGLSRTFGDGITHEGFGGSTGQWSIVWANRAAFDDIVAAVRSTVLITMSALTGQKWTSTQSTANFAYYWTTAANGNGKGLSYRCVPFFAFLNS